MAAATTQQRTGLALPRLSAWSPGLRRAEPGAAANKDRPKTQTQTDSGAGSGFVGLKTCVSAPDLPPRSPQSRSPPQPGDADRYAHRPSHRRASAAPQRPPVRDKQQCARYFKCEKFQKLNRQRDGYHTHWADVSQHVDSTGAD